MLQIHSIFVLKTEKCAFLFCLFNFYTAAQEHVTVVKIIEYELIFSSIILGIEIQKTLIYISGKLSSVYTEDGL